MALLLLNTRGIERDFISPERLNKARRATGKPPIPSHTVLRIGTVYDRDGREVGDGHRRAMRVHMRADHARNQACGPNRVDRHVVYIPPVLVNYSAGGRRAGAAAGGETLMIHHAGSPAQAT